MTKVDDQKSWKNDILSWKSHGNSLLDFCGNPESLICYIKLSRMYGFHHLRFILKVVLNEMFVLWICIINYIQLYKSSHAVFYDL